MSLILNDMANMEPAEFEEWREHLLRYCELDTYAMVKIWEKLKGKIRRKKNAN